MCAWLLHPLHAFHTSLDPIRSEEPQMASPCVLPGHYVTSFGHMNRPGSCLCRGNHKQRSIIPSLQTSKLSNVLKTTDEEHSKTVTNKIALKTVFNIKQLTAYVIIIFLNATCLICVIQLQSVLLDSQARVWLELLYVNVQVPKLWICLHENNCWQAASELLAFTNKIQFSFFTVLSCIAFIKIKERRFSDLQPPCLFAQSYLYSFCRFHSILTACFHI